MAPPVAVAPRGTTMPAATTVTLTPPPHPKYDQELLEAIFQDLQNLKQFTGLTEPDLTPEGAGFNPAHDLSPAGEENTAHSHLSPAGGRKHCSFPSLPRRGRDTERGRSHTQRSRPHRGDVPHHRRPPDRRRPRQTIRLRPSTKYPAPQSPTTTRTPTRCQPAKVSPRRAPN